MLPDGRLVVRDELHGMREVQLACAHFSGGSKCHLNAAWLREHFGIELEPQQTVG